MGRRKKQKLPFEHWQIIELLHITQDFYSKPENEAAFQEWKAARDARKAKRPAGAIVLGLAAAGCGGAIENAANGWAMLGYTLLAIVLGCAALALAGLGLVAEQRKEPQKIHKVPENTVKKAVCGRKVG